MTEISLPRVEQPLVSVVMVLYGGWELAQRAIGALAANTDPCFELVLVDNASRDDTPQRVEEHMAGFSRPTIVTSRSNNTDSRAASSRASAGTTRSPVKLSAPITAPPGRR